MTDGQLRPRALTPTESTAVHDLLAAAAAADGVEPVSEAGVLALDSGGGRLLADDDGVLAGYAHLDAGTAELVVHPEHRRRGVGSRLLDALERAAGGALQVWAHGRIPAAAALADKRGYEQTRALLRLRRDGLDHLPDAPPPAGVTIRAFRPGADDTEWLAVNARAFADHPEQGRFTQADLDARLRADWFDAAGFLLAVRSGRIIGSHWTKVHTEPERVGEIYILGVDPAAQAGGLGTPLAVAGLGYLRDRGLPAVILYVEGSNPAALRLYDRLGFRCDRLDALYRRPAGAGGAMSGRPGAG